MVSQILSKYFSVFVDELIECGVDSVVLSPGSRSTPLAMLFYARKEIKCYMNIDERSAAFFALGLSKESQTPTVLVCTSGSAAANYYPAIVEANLARVPLIVITADRPPYMQGVGAAQTMYQKELYGRHVVYHEELALAKNDFDYQLLREKAAHFFLLSKNLKGVVHINAPVEEEVIPEILDEYYSVGRNQKICGAEVKIAFSAQESLLSHLQNKKVLIVVGFED
ncbi:MAG: thiamine pyrophosphate-binding protein, partial [Fusobacteria bacterium]|nr:thiamine pyrophosphate-binding protein [Fusobacteriota bacterium]